MKRIWITPTIILGLLVAGCAGFGSRSGGSSPTTPPENAGVAVTVAPTTAMVRAGATQAFTAAVTGNANTSVTWSVNAAAGGNSATGTIDATGLYTAPANLPTPNKITVTATSAPEKAMLTSVSPNTIAPGAFSLTLNGSGFLKTSAVTFGGQTLTAMYVSATELQAVGNAMAAQVGNVPVMVRNPDPGAAASSSLMATVVGGSAPVSATAAVRFLEESTFGPTPELVSQVQQIGFAPFLATQLAAPASTYPTPLSTDTNLTKVQDQFWRNAVNDSDQLRQRVAFALNEIWVVSQNKVNNPTGYTNYMQALTNDALGNYYDVMKDVTLSAAMGHFLDMLNNDKPATGQHANENYARESMQLFTLGLSLLNPDGTPAAR